MSETTAKKRRHPADDTQDSVPTKKSKKERHDKKDKGKARDGEFLIVKASLAVSIPPIFANDPRSGVEEMLDSMIMRYIPDLQGVVLTHSNLRFVSKTATILRDCPFLVCTVGFDATVWSPRIGMKLTGKISLCSPDHISVLVHRTFNVSIPRHHIPIEEWVFEYGAAENDPEYGPNAQQQDEGEGGATTKREGTDGGKWVHHLTNSTLGGDEGLLEFTVIGLTVANEMLSLIGSLQVDPFSPRHLPLKGGARSQEEEESEVEEIVEPASGISDQDGEEDEVESDEDTFEALGRMTDKVMAEGRRGKKAEEAKDKRRGSSRSKKSIKVLCQKI